MSTSDSVLRALLHLALAVLLLGSCLPGTWTFGPALRMKHGAFHRLAAGGRHTCVVRPRGDVRCWGDNDAGQLGDGTQTYRPVPVTVRGLDDAVALAAGEKHNCALRRSGAVACWGDNSAGQLGRSPEKVPRAFTPQGMPGLPAAVEIVAGTGFACARTRTGKVLCWGQLASEITARYGAIVVPGIGYGPAPTPLKKLDPVIGLAAGGQHLCALHRSGEVSCLGRNTSGQLGDGTERDRSSPVRVKGLKDAIAITAGALHTCALHRSGAVSCWGENFEGQVGGVLSRYHSVNLPIVVAGVLADEVVAGGAHTCARLRPRGVTCWGHRDWSSSATQPVLPLRWQPEEAQRLEHALELAAGEKHSCALRPSGEVDCWGDNSAGQLGRGDRPAGSIRPRPVVGISQAIKLAAGEQHTCALLANGEARCWGDNGSSQLGGFEGPFSSRPLVLGELAGVILLAAGAENTCVQQKSGALRCFGAAFSGNRPVWPPRPLPGLGAIKAVAFGNYHTCALEPSGLVRCWGENRSGQLGQGSSGGVQLLQDKRAPLAVLGLDDAIALAAGANHTCTVHETGRVSCWGNNPWGQCGPLPAQANELSTPVLVEKVVGAKALAAGSSHNCALLDTREVVCWGRNDYGQLGSGSAARQAGPVQVRGINDAVALAAGEEHSCVVHATGKLSCWGRNFYGELGSGVPESEGWRPAPDHLGVPTTVQGLEAVAEVVCGEEHTCARLRSGKVACWGSNERGQLGDGSVQAAVAAGPVQGL